MIPGRVAVVGAGRVGLSVARALARTGHAVDVLTRTARELPEPLSPPTTSWGPALAKSALVIVAVPDDAIGSVATALASTRTITADHCVLHTSGLHDRSALAALADSGAARGSWHPLQTFALPAGEPAALPGSPAIIEGDERALAVARQLADLLHLRPVIEMPAAGKAAYHAAAVFASSYLVAIAEIAARIAGDAGARDATGELFLPLMRRTLANYAAAGAGRLTGPVVRGDAGTVASHLRALNDGDRELYVALASEVLRLVRGRALDERAAMEIEALLTAK